MAWKNQTSKKRAISTVNCTVVLLHSPTPIHTHSLSFLLLTILAIYLSSLFLVCLFVDFIFQYVKLFFGCCCCRFKNKVPTNVNGSSIRLHHHRRHWHNNRPTIYVYIRTYVYYGDDVNVNHLHVSLVSNYLFVFLFAIVIYCHYENLDLKFDLNKMCIYAAIDLTSFLFAKAFLFCRIKQNK